jgi:hypothetical protein
VPVASAEGAVSDREPAYNETIGMVVRATAATERVAVP